MAEDKAELEMLFKLWCRDYHYEIGEDSDGLGNIELRYYEEREKAPIARISMMPKHAEQLRDALTRVLEWMKSSRKGSGGG